MAGFQLIEQGIEIGYIPIDPVAIPYQFQIKLVNRTYTLVVKWNDYAACYTLDLISIDNIILAYGDPVRYGRPVFGNIEDERFPLPVIIPYSFIGNEEEVTRENFGRTVQLYMFDRETLTASQTASSLYKMTFDDGSMVPVIPPMRPPFGGVDDEFPPYYHMHMIESIVDLPVQLSRLGHAPIPIDIVISILGSI
ncbi:hypothetical protein FACS1894184_18940 [Clostridia bacterium]|nr:hypothetical protein FACS1894184_18940 [Clostridia bacterium]